MLINDPFKKIPEPGAVFELADLPSTDGAKYRDFLRNNKEHFTTLSDQQSQSIDAQLITDLHQQGKFLIAAIDQLTSIQTVEIDSEDTARTFLADYPSKKVMSVSYFTVNESFRGSLISELNTLRFSWHNLSSKPR